MKAGTRDAAGIVSDALAQRKPADRTGFLRELLAHTAAAIVVLEGEEEGAMSCYRLADAVVARRDRHG